MDKRQPQSDVILIESSELWDGWSYRIDRHVSSSSLTFYGLELYHDNDGHEDEHASMKGFQSTEDVKSILTRFRLALRNHSDYIEFLHSLIDSLKDKSGMDSPRIVGTWVRNKTKMEDPPPANLWWEDDENHGIVEIAK